jgi:hypothetical protein
MIGNDTLFRSIPLVCDIYKKKKKKKKILFELARKKAFLPCMFFNQKRNEC